MRELRGSAWRRDGNGEYRAQEQQSSPKTHDGRQRDIKNQQGRCTSKIYYIDPEREYSVRKKYPLSLDTHGAKSEPGTSDRKGRETSRATRRDSWQEGNAMSIVADSPRECRSPRLSQKREKLFTQLNIPHPYPSRKI